jgi:hypothetical protein
MAEGINKLITYKEESAWGEKPTNTGGQLLRRVTGAFQLEKETYQSNEINESQQVKDFRHGTRRSNGSLSAEISGTAYKDFIAAALRRNFTTGVTTGAVTTISVSESGGVSKFVRATGSFITDGFKVGDVVVSSGFASPLNNTLTVVVNVIALELTVEHFSETGALLTVAAGPSVTVAVKGQKTFAPTTGHTDKSFTIEEWHSDDEISRISLGQQVDTMAINVAPNSMATIEFGFMGKNAEPSTGSRYFTAPTAQPNEGVYSGPDGLLIINGVANRKVTSLSLSLANGITQEAVIGSNSIGAKSRGKINATGSLSAIFDSNTFLNYFDGETEVAVTYALRSADGLNAFAITMPRVKFGSGTTDDGEKVIILSADFTALERIDGSTIQTATTIAIQDTTIV